MSPLNFFRKIPTTLEINGPILSFVDSQPVSISVCDGGIATFRSGVVTATFPVQTPPNPAENTGIVTYRWYEVGVGALSDVTNVTGTGTTILTLSNLRSPSDNNRQFFIRADYIPSAYAIGKSTGNANNEFLDSGIVGITVYPTISITSQPESQTVSQNNPATFSINASTTDITQGDLSYQWTANGSNLSDSSLVSGSRSNNLTISSANTGIQTVQCKVSHPTSCNSPIYSNVVNFSVVSARAILNWNRRLDGSTTYNEFGNGSFNLADGSYTFDAYTPRSGAFVELWAPERDIIVRATVAGAAGQNGYGLGGDGGVTIAEFLIEKETEFIFKIGSLNPPTGGANGGGGSTVIYKKSKILLLSGGGGAPGQSGRGGAGGGAGIAGENGSNGDGFGGQAAFDGTLPVTGYFPDGSFYFNGQQVARTGGRISACPPGGDGRNPSDYWKSRFAPCDELGYTTFLNLNASSVANTPTLFRGYKPGLGHRNNGGNGAGTEGGGGGGAYGGTASSSGTGGGGGGGSGYSSGVATIISSTLGGNSSTSGFIKLELVI